MLNALIKFHYTQPFILACSGGVDSIAIASFFVKGQKNFGLAYFNHGTPQADEMESCVVNFARQNKLAIHLGKIDRERGKGESPEEYYRNCRYQFLNSLQSDIVTAKHLDDVVEGWVFSCLHGNPKLMKVLSFLPNKFRLCRPFLTNRKEDLISWCQNNSLSWVEDKSNQDQHYPRNFIRHTLIENALKINPGLHKTLKKKILLQVQADK